MREGSVIAHRYELLRLAGSGGMGSVYQARDVESGQLVALKLIRTAGELLVKRLVREGRALAELNHPGIVRYLSHGLTAGGEPFLVVEWLAGLDLGERLRRGALDVPATLEILRSTADALGAAHRRGIVHRDVKPGNLFLAQEADAGETLLDEPARVPTRLKVLDFGIALLRAASERPDRALGTPGYLAPEQARGEREVDARADVFALGCVVFACLTQRSPFKGDDPEAVLFAEAPRLGTVCPDVPVQLEALVAAMLSRDPERRPADGSAVLNALDATPILRGRTASAAVAAAAVGAGEQQLVSVLILASGLAPAARLRQIAEAHGAKVVELGEAGTALAFPASSFGIDAAVRAARCALALRLHLPATFMALTTARGLVERGGLPAAEVIDRAAALLGAGGAAVRLDEVTAALLDQRFRLGRDEAGALLVEERGLASGSRPVLGRRATLVGRDRELATLRAICDEAASESHARAALVIGAAGSGKSRLRLELLEQLAADELRREAWVGQGDPMRSGSPLAVLADALRVPLGVSGDGGEGEAADKRASIRARVAGCLPAAEVARVSELLGELVGVPFPEEESVQLRAARRDPLIMGVELRCAFEDWLSAELECAPVVLVLEDLHWGDWPSLKLVNGALRNLADRPLVVIGLARPEFSELYGGVWAERGLEQIHLRELGRAGCERLVRQLLGEATTPELAARLAQRSQGNPFYLEELVRAVAENGAGAELPETVLAMVDSRMGRLPAELRKVLRAASVFGETFWEEGVAALLGRPDPAELRQLLAELGDREWIAARRASRLPGQHEHAFRHALLGEAAYATLPAGDRARAHAQAARWLEEAGEPDPAALAAHEERGGETARAIVGWRRAARLALDGNDFEAAIARAERAVALGAAGEALGELRLTQAEAHDWRSEHARARPCAEEALALLPRGGPLWASAAHHAAWTYRVLGDTEALERLAATLGEVAARGPSGALVISMCATAIKLFEAGRYERAAALLAEVEARAPAGDALVEAWLANAREYQAMMASDPAAMLRSLRVSLMKWEAAGDQRNANVARVNMAVALLELGAFAEAERALRAAIVVAERLGAALLVDGCRQNLGWALALQGRLDEARAEEERAADAYRTRGDDRYEGISRLYLARIALWAGDRPRAGEACRAALRLLDEVPSWRAYARAVSATIDGDAAAARAAMDELTALGSIEEGDAFVRLAHAEALRAGGRAEEAAAALAEARARLEARAARIEDAELRRSFLEAVPDNAATLRG